MGKTNTWSRFQANAMASELWTSAQSAPGKVYTSKTLHYFILALKTGKH